MPPAGYSARDAMRPLALTRWHSRLSVHCRAASSDAKGVSGRTARPPRRQCVIRDLEAAENPYVSRTFRRLEREKVAPQVGFKLS
jgi:hypothetical protein